MKTKRIAVIGAGPSGITALKNLLDKGLDVVCFEASSNVGGNWVFSDEPGHSSVFESTHIISSRSLSEYHDFPFDEFDPTTPDYPSHRHLAAYFQEYARRFDLYPHIRFQTRVAHARLHTDSTWVLTLNGPDGEKEEVVSHLVVCNGHHWNPRYPDYPGDFTGEFLHAHDFKRAAPFTGKRVLVIGGGNSACDVAVETSRVSEKTDISWRRGYWIVPKFMFGNPSDVVGKYLSRLPVRVWTKLSEWGIKLWFGSNKRYGLPNPDGKFASHHPTVNDELFYRIRHGAIGPRTDVRRFDGDRVEFVDGSVSEYDTVIACTGYIITFPFFDRGLIDYSTGPVPLYLRMIHPEIENVYFIGLIQPLGCVWPLAELQAQIAAREIAGEWKRPAGINKHIERDLKSPYFNQSSTPRHTITVDFHRFRRRLLKELSI